MLKNPASTCDLSLNIRMHRHWVTIDNYFSTR
jgi:hypothetical protein